VGERHVLDGVSLCQVTRELNQRGVPIDQRHTGRVFRDFVSLTHLARGDEEVVRERLRAQGGIVLMCDGVQFDERSPVLYLVWDATSGEPLFGERKAYRSEADLVPLLERVRAMNVPVIGVVTDKETGLVPAVARVFPKVPYQYCQTHFLKNCAKPLQRDLTALQASVHRRAEAVRELGKHVFPSASTNPEAGASAESATGSAVGMGEQELAREVCELVRVNSRVTGKSPLDPAELKRHQRLEDLKSLVNEAQQKKAQAPHEWPLLDRLAKALELTWHEARTAGRVVRHTEILRGVARELSNAPEREQRPRSAREAKDRFDSYLQGLATTVPRRGLAAPTAAFLDTLIERSQRYGDHLFVCFDHPSIPPTTNSLEGFFGQAKATIRSALRAGSTTNSVVSNLGADVLVAYQYLRRPDALAQLRASDATPAAFTAMRAQLDRNEAPGVRRRSLVRHFKHHVARLRHTWRNNQADADA
jgi:hypothetical protein